MGVRRYRISLECVQHDISRIGAANEWDNELNTSNQVLFCFLYKHLTRKISLLDKWEKSDRVARKASDVSASDWRSQTQRLRLRLFSGLDILVKHRILSNKLPYHKSLFKINPLVYLKSFEGEVVFSGVLFYCCKFQNEKNSSRRELWSEANMLREN